MPVVENHFFPHEWPVQLQIDSQAHCFSHFRNTFIPFLSLKNCELATTYTSDTTHAIHKM